jgi:Flp pilus assembly secretin CpaC
LAKVLAEPTLVMVSGRPASFRSGGNMPIVVPQSDAKKMLSSRRQIARCWWPFL